jgi:apolipoprotein N-acyltransferase
VQPNIEQGKKWEPEYEQFIMGRLGDLTRAASKESPALIVWPETATPRSITENHGLFRQVRKTATETGSPILLGSAEPQKYARRDPQRKKYLNSAFLIHPENVKRKVQRYDKIRLLPFGEYLPKNEIIPWERMGVPNMGGYLSGKEFTVFRYKDVRFCTLICWETLFPDLVRSFTKRGSDLIVNITNEAWFGATAAPYQFLAMNVFRSVEHRVSMVRCANTGISCFIDPCGRIIGRVRKDKKDIFVRGYLTKEVPIWRTRTVYTLYGNWLAHAALAVSVLVLVLSLIRGKRHSYGA